MAIFYTLIITITVCTVLAGYGAQAQQLYSGDAEPAVACNNSGSDIYLGYYNNGPASCKTSLTFRSQYPWNTLSKIASLLNVDTDDVAQANPNYRTYDDIEWNKLVYVPVTCSVEPSVGSHYVKPTSHTVVPADSYFHLANNTYQGLVTCQAIRFMNNIDQDPSNFAIGKNLTIPLRCACPTINQQRTKGITSLLTYVVGEGDTISSISTEFMVDIKSIPEANRLSEKSVIYPFTTLLIPVTVMDSVYDRSSSSSTFSSQTTQAAPPSTTVTNSFKGKIRAIVIGVVATVVLGIIGVIGAKFMGFIDWLRPPKMTCFRCNNRWRCTFLHCVCCPGENTDAVIQNKNDKHGLPKVQSKKEKDRRPERKREPDPRPERKREPDPRAERKREPDPRAERKREQDPRGERKREKGPKVKNENKH